MNKLTLTSPLGPSVNNYLNYRVRKQGKRSFVQAYMSNDTLVYRQFFIDYVKDQIKEQGWVTPEKGKQVYVYMTFFMDRKKKDPNNFIKVPFDALTDAGVFIDDDIALPVADRVYIDSLNPRIEIEIFEAESIGIFENMEELEEFKVHNCYNCKRNIETCGVLKKILDNRIIPEVQDGICEKKKPIKE